MNMFAVQRDPAEGPAPGVAPMQGRFQTEDLDVDVMGLTDAEIEWAWAIKEALLQQEEVRMVSDYEIAQVALVSLGLEDLESVLERLLVLQCLREEYNLNETPDEAVELVRRMTCQQQPGHILAFDLAPDSRSYVGVFDFAKIKPTAVKDPEDWRIYLGGYYYLLSAACANLTNVRDGFLTIIECEGECNGLSSLI